MNECWEKLERKIEKVTIVSINAVAMYPSIKLPLVKQSNLILHTELILICNGKYWLVFQNHWIWDDFNPFNISRQVLRVWRRRFRNKGMSNWRLQISVLGIFGGFLSPQGNQQ